MSDEDKHTISTEAPSEGASASERPSVATTSPALKATAGGKARPRPSVANKKRAHVVVPEEKGSRRDAQRAPLMPGATEVLGAEGEAAQPPEGGVAAGAADEHSNGSAVPGSPENVTPTSPSAKTDDAQRPKKKHTVLIVLGIIFGIIVVLVLAVVIGFCCMRWVIPQDHDDLQGKWTLIGASGDINITANEIDLAGEASYDYTIDTTSKTLDVTFSKLEGSTHYRFSRDRSAVALIEGVDTSWQATLMEDLKWDWADFMAWTRGEVIDPLGTEEGIILCRQDVATASTDTTDAANTLADAVSTDGASAEQSSDADTQAAAQASTSTE